MSVPIFQVDAFTDVRFSGNPAAVCLLTDKRSAAWMQAIAAEMNLSETAFVWPVDNGFSLRWFTPTVEVSLCGHATLAAAHVLWESGRLPPDARAQFHTRSGLLAAVRRAGWIELDFPALSVSPAEPPSGLLEALGTEARFVGTNGHDMLVEVASERAVRTLAPDFRRLRSIDARGTIVTSVSEATGYDFVSRFFAPAVGIDEDPVTGSAHCSLGPFWGTRLRKSSLTGRQVSARGGTVRVLLKDGRVRIAGQAVTILRGELV